MNTSLNSSAPVLRHYLRTVVAFFKRTSARSGRVLAPVPAMGEVLMVGLTIVAGLSLGAVANRAHAAEPAPARDAGERILQSHAFVADEIPAEAERLLAAFGDRPRA
jgi:hypothetical protein